MPAAAATSSAQDIQRASNITCGAAVKPSTGKWFAYRGSSAYIPNYWNIESEGYTDTGFSISGYIHDSDAWVMAAAPALRAALKELLDAFEASPDDLDAHEYEAIVADAKSRARAALKLAEI